MKIHYSTLLRQLDGNTPKRRGSVGEIDCFDIIKRYAVKNNVYSKLIHNVILPRCQIDLIYINHFGVFVIEVKNWIGLIKGKPSDSKWVRYYRNRVFEYKNPIFQNLYHVDKVKRLLDSDIPVYSLIIFSSNNITSLKIDDVIDMKYITRYFSSFKGEKKLSSSQIDSLYDFFMKTPLI